MRARSKAILVLVLAAGWPAMTAVQAQPAAERRERPRAGPRRRQPGPPPWGSGDRERMYGFMAERYLDRFTSTYELTDQQREEVRLRLEELVAEQREYAEPLREEFEGLRGEMRELWRKRSAGEEYDEERMSEIRRRMGELWRGSPLMNAANVTDDIEQMLPAEQVRKGQERREARRAEWERGRGRFRQGPEGRRQGRWEMGGGRFGRGDRWDRYVEVFARRYQLDPSQEATARSVLRTLKEQRDRYQEAHEADFAAARQIDDRQQRGRKLAELNEPLDELFEQLRQRLDQIPTAAQKTAVEQRGVRSRPAGATTRPAGAASRPAGAGREP